MILVACIIKLQGSDSVNVIIHLIGKSDTLNGMWQDASNVLYNEFSAHIF